MKKIGESFGDVSEEEVQSFMRNVENKEQFDIFFSGEGQNRIFIFYQPGDMLNEQEEEDWTAETPPKELFLGDANSTRLLDKCCYFLRNAPPLTSIDDSSQLLFGEIGGNALQVYHIFIISSYLMG